MIGEGGDRRFHPWGGHQNRPFREWDYMIPYMVGQLASNSSYLTRGLVKYVHGRGYFRAVPSQNSDEFVTSPTSRIVERVCKGMGYVGPKFGTHVPDRGAVEYLNLLILERLSRKLDASCTLVMLC